MTRLDLTANQKYLVIALIAIFMVITLWIRLLPAPEMITDSGVNLLGNDPWYNLRQVEQVTAHFPGYAWFDAMTLFPFGDTIYWGPLFIWITSFVAIITGATARPEMMVAASYIPPIMAALVVPLVYLIAARIADWKTGLIAAGLTAVVSGQYLYRSLFGFVDHHIAEVLFSTLFCLCYITLLETTKDRQIDLHDISTYRTTAGLAVATGITYLLGLFTMSTMVLFAFIVAVFTIIQFIWDFSRVRSSEYLLLINLVVFTTALIGYLLFGIKHAGIDLSRYTIGHAIAYAALIAGTAFLYALSRYLKGRPWYQYLLSIAGTGLIGALVLMFVAPAIYNTLFASMFAFFGQQAVTFTVQEARGWSMELAWNTFHYGLLLMIGGICYIFWKNWKEEHPDQIFVLIWSVIVLFSTIQHVRYEYYLAVNVVLLSSLFIGSVLDFGLSDIMRLLARGKNKDVEEEPEPEDEKGGKKKKKGKKAKQTKKKQIKKSNTPDYLKIGSVVLVAGFTLLFVSSSVQYDLGMASSAYLTTINGDWRESLEWMEANTPDPGVDYYAIDERETFTYPPQAYGVMSWWDYGHWITFLGKRIPSANPFQRGVAGDLGSAAFFITQSEDWASHIADELGIRYVVTDIEMDTGKFWAMATWFNASANTTPYQQAFLPQVPDSANPYYSFYDQNYYTTMVSSLHNFDGSMVDPTEVVYIEYRDFSPAEISDPQLSSGLRFYNENHIFPLGYITGGEVTDPASAKARAAAFNEGAARGTHADVVNTNVLQPADRVPALQHFRLVHESPTNMISSTEPGAPDIKYVKVFEYVTGAHIRGAGTIEVPVISNMGRIFIYRQESRNGEFIVPYATADSPYEVQAIGNYRIVETGEEFAVPESAVQQGSYLN